MRYSSTGKYYKSGSAKYWTAAYGANIQIASGSDGPVYYYSIDKVRKLTNTIKNASKSNSYLQMDYDYTVGCYFGVRGYGVLINSCTVKGNCKFANSYIPWFSVI